MGTVFRKTFTKPIPKGADISERKGRRTARWRDRRGRLRMELVTVGKDGTDRLLIQTGPYYAKYRDGQGNVCEVATGCRDETAARRKLADLERQADLVKVGVLTPAEQQQAGHSGRPLTEHLAAYDEHLQAKGVTGVHREDTGRYLRRLAADCSFATLADLRREGLERWLAARAREG